MAPRYQGELKYNNIRNKINFLGLVFHTLSLIPESSVVDSYHFDTDPDPASDTDPVQSLSLYHLTSRC